MLPLALVAAIVLAALPARSQTTPTIRVATVPFEAGAEPYYAAAAGIFQKAGLNVQIISISSGAAISAAVVGGGAEIGFSNIVSLASAHDAGVPIVIIAPASRYLTKVPQTALIVAKSSAVNAAKDLNGKIVAVNGLRSIAEIGADAWLDQNGGNSAAVHFVEMTNGAIGDAVASGRVAAGIVSEPELTAALANTRVLGWAYDAIGKQFALSAWFTTSAWAHAHPDLIERYVTAMAETARWANTHQAESAKVLEAQEGVHVTAATKRVVYAEKLDVTEMQASIDAAARYKVIRSNFPAAELLF